MISLTLKKTVIVQMQSHNIYRMAIKSLAIVRNGLQRFVVLQLLAPNVNGNPAHDSPRMRAVCRNEKNKIVRLNVPSASVRSVMSRRYVIYDLLSLSIPRHHFHSHLFLSLKIK